MVHLLSAWEPPSFCTTASPTGEGLAGLAEEVYERVCRTDFDAPGFCLVDLGREASSQQLRRFMISLRTEMRAIHQARMHRDLAILSAARFDQQVTTKLHRDGGPDECFLMLGYEPSPVCSEVLLADYSRCASDMGLTPEEFLDRHNPMFMAGEQLLQPYTTRVVCFSNDCCQVLLVNNSMSDYAPGRSWQGVLHTARILNPDDAHHRVINSTMVASVAAGTKETVSVAELDDFVETSVVHRRGYDKLHLDDG